MYDRRASARGTAGWVALWLTAVALVGCTSASPDLSLGTPTPTYPPLPPITTPFPSATPVAAHATANALLLTAVAAENRGDIAQAVAAAGTALAVGTSVPADARQASGFLTRAPARATFTANENRIAALTATALADNPRPAPAPRGSASQQ
jgi:hypothetical protein